MDPGPMVTERIEAGARFLAEFNKFAPITVAFWLAQDEGGWMLHVSAEGIEENVDKGYREVGRITRRLRDPWCNSMQVKLIYLNWDIPLVQPALALRERFHGHGAGRLFDSAFGNVWAKEVYVYPSPLPASS